jgi:transposase
MADCNTTLNQVSSGTATIGVDLGDKFSEFCVLDSEGEVFETGRFRTNPDAFRKHFEPLARARVAIEVGTHSPWASRVIEECGHEVLVANSRQLPVISKNHKKSDQTDAELLARLARLDPKLLKPIEHRDRATQQALAALRARDCLVKARTQLINHVRGAVKSFGARLTGCSAESFHRKAPECIPQELRYVLDPVVKTVGELTTQIRWYDQVIEKQYCEKKYPKTKSLRQPKGVGALTALAFMLIIRDPKRFKKSRDVGAYLGMVPRKHDSGQRETQLGITKAGDSFLRRLLVGSAHYILGPFGEDSDLRRYGKKIAERGGKNAKKRAVVAVARKLSVLLLRLWVTGEVYEPLRNSEGKKRRTQSPSSAGEPKN